MYTENGTLDVESTLEKYAPMVRRLANQLASRLPPNVHVGDMVQAGMIGLMEAVSRFDEEGGARFETFATQRIRGAMLDELRGTDWLPRSARRAQRNIEKAIGDLEQRLMRPPAEHEIAAEMDLSLDAYHKLLNEARGTQLMYLDDLNGAETGDAYLDRHVVAEPNGVLDVLSDTRFRDALVAAIDKLPEREQQVMAMYYEQDLNLREIGEVLGVTESRISQLHSQAVARLRQSMTTW